MGIATARLTGLEMLKNNKGSSSRTLENAV